MSTTDFSPDPATDPGHQEGAGGAKDQAQEAAGTAKDEGKRVAGVAKDEAQRVSGEAMDQVRSLVGEATSQVDTQSKEQKAKLAETVRTFGDDLHTMTHQGEGTDGLAGQLVQQVADRASSLASHLEDREPRELVDDLRDFARRRPGTFLLGALAAGVVAGRLTRGAKAAQDSQDSSVTPSTTAVSTPAPSTTPVTPAVATTPHLGSKGVEMSETGVVGTRGGRL